MNAIIVNGSQWHSAPVQPYSSVCVAEKFRRYFVRSRYYKQCEMWVLTFIRLGAEPFAWQWSELSILTEIMNRSNTIWPRVSYDLWYKVNRICTSVSSTHGKHARNTKPPPSTLSQFLCVARVCVPVRGTRSRCWYRSTRREKPARRPSHTSSLPVSATQCRTTFQCAHAHRIVLYKMKVLQWKSETKFTFPTYRVNGMNSHPFFQFETNIGQNASENYSENSLTIAAFRCSTPVWIDTCVCSLRHIWHVNRVLGYPTEGGGDDDDYTSRI